MGSALQGVPCLPEVSCSNALHGSPAPLGSSWGATPTHRQPGLQEVYKSEACPGEGLEVEPELWTAGFWAHSSGRAQNTGPGRNRSPLESLSGFRTLSQLSAVTTTHHDQSQPYLVLPTSPDPQWVGRPW